MMTFDRLVRNPRLGGLHGVRKQVLDTILKIKHSSFCLLALPRELAFRILYKHL